MSHGQDQISPAMQKALELLKQNRAADAEEVLVRAAGAAEERFGRGSPAHATAQDDLGNLHAFLGDMRGAVACYRRACEGPPPADTQARRDRLTYLVNFAAALEALDELDEAEQVHRQGVAGRRTFYGPDHPGYAFGLEPLATLLLRRGRPQEALQLLDECAANFRRNGHPRVAGALALRAEALKAVGDPQPPFAGLEQLPDQVLTDLAGTVLQRAGKTDPVWARQVLADLLALVESRFGLDHGLTLNVLATVANHEADQGERGDHDVRLGAIRRSLASLERQGRTAESLHALQGLALALNMAGRHDDALAAYREALERALRAGDRAVVSQVRRNYGLYLADLKRPEEAEQQLRAAVDDGEAAEDLERWGRAEASLGIFLMHQGRAAEVPRLLEAALRRLDAAHPDAVCARLHLNAHDAGQPCSCGDTREALAEQLRLYILSQLPKGFLEKLELTIEDDDVKVGVHLARQPTPDEVQRLQILVNQAIHTFKKQIGRRP
jgi:tetratricopeptide (TPR) repeat protein